MNKHLKYLSFAIAALGFMGTAFAQYVWLNENGTKQYSDQPPPSSVPQNRILKSPTGQGQMGDLSGTGNHNADNLQSSDKANAPMSTAEKKADFIKRRTEQAEKEKKAAEEQQLAAAKTKNCERAREYQRTLNSGERISKLDESGERSFLSDDDREREARETRRILDDCK